MYLLVVNTLILYFCSNCIEEKQYIDQYYSGQNIWGITKDEFYRLRSGKWFNESLMLCALQRQITPPWRGMERIYLESLVTDINPMPPSEKIKNMLQRSNVVFILHSYPNHWGAVIVVREDSTLSLVMVDGLRKRDDGILQKYVNYFHYLETNASSKYDFQRTYVSNLQVNFYMPLTQTQTNTWDCGLHVLLYHKTTHAWYGVTTGVCTGKDRIVSLILALEKITPHEANVYRKTIREHMHTWTDEWWRSQSIQLPEGLRQSKTINELPTDIFKKYSGERTGGDCAVAAALGTVMQRLDQVDIPYQIHTCSDVRRYMVDHVQKGTLLQRAQLREHQDVFHEELLSDIRYVLNQVKPIRGPEESLEAFNERAWERIKQTEEESPKNHSIWWQGTTLGLVIRALILDAGFVPNLSQDLASIKQQLFGCMPDLITDTNLMLMNADLGILIIEEEALVYPEVVKACLSAKVVILNKNADHFIAYFHNSNGSSSGTSCSSIVSGSGDGDGCNASGSVDGGGGGVSGDYSDCSRIGSGNGLGKGIGCVTTHDTAVDANSA